ncbi:hypothetical protein BV20DRAFT_862640 [Pilatotrama ljubarskyi]|nr:hypothetical protein BV20DRAFT_862640 [Pilatotrama ljubarskyi]
MRYISFTENLGPAPFYAGAFPVTSMSTPSNTTSTPLDPFALLPKLPALDNTFGAVLLGTFLGLILYGLNLHQSYRYFRLYPADSRILKGLVVAVMFLETVTSIFSMHVCYDYLVTNYFKPEALLHGIWSINLFPVASGIVMLTSQSFFARRVWLVGPHFRPVVIVASVLCIGELGFFIAATSEAFIIPTFQGFRKFTWLVSTGSTMAVTADVLLTIALIVVLQRSRTGLKRTDSMIDVMITYSVNTGGLFNLLSLLFAFIRPGDLIYIGFGIPGVKLYATTLLAALNSRQSLASRGFGISCDTSPFGFAESAAPPSATLGSRRIHAPQAADSFARQPRQKTRRR